MENMAEIMENNSAVFSYFKGESKENIKMPEPNRPVRKVKFYFHGWEGDSIEEAKEVRAKMRRTQMLRFRKKIICRELKKYRQKMAAKRKTHVPTPRRVQIVVRDWEEDALEEATRVGAEVLSSESELDVQEDAKERIIIVARDISRKGGRNRLRGLDLIYVCTVLGACDSTALEELKE